MDTNTLITKLAQDAKSARSTLKPGWLALLLLGVLAIYGVGAQFYLGLRPDLMFRLTDFWYEAEITALWFLILTSAFASIAAMAPDAYQKPIALQLPYVVFAALIAILGYQFCTETDMAAPHFMSKFLAEVTHLAGMECSICIALLSAIPSAFVFALLKKGASVRPLMSGSFAVFTAAGIGCLTLRLAEPNDSIIHLVQWHYLPTLVIAILGAFIGKWLLKW